MIVSKQRLRSIPTKPPAFLPVQKALPELVTQATNVVAIYAARLETSDECEEQTRRTIMERDSVCIGNIYSNMKPTSAPDTYKVFIGKSLDV